MRKLVMGFDGTWNTPDQMDRDRQVPTNVVKLLRALQSGAGLLKYYDTGVGTVGRLDRLWGRSPVVVMGFTMCASAPISATLIMPWH